MARLRIIGSRRARKLTKREDKIDYIPIRDFVLFVVCSLFGRNRKKCL